MKTNRRSKKIDSKSRAKKPVKKQCTVCGKRVFDRRNLVRHMKVVHSIEPPPKKAGLKCSFNQECEFLCASNELLRKHLNVTHNLKFKKRILTFRSKIEFGQWRVEEEIVSNARYVAYTGTKTKSTGKVFYLKCHKSGSVQSKNGEKKQAEPGKGDTQSGPICPSTIRVTESADGTIHVMYYPDHLGHNLNDESVRNMKLSATERQEILEKLALGEPVGKIVTEARKKKGNRLSRLNFLQRRDVYNLKKQIIYLEKDDEQDAKSVHAWVRGLNLESDENTAIVYYSPLNKYKDYVLVIIHDMQKEVFRRVFEGGIVYVKTKKGKANLDFNMTCVSIVDGKGGAFPIAFCISQRAEYITLYTLYQTMFRSFGKIKPKFFVSDNLNQSYLAWKNVMGECENQMVCIFDLESYWGQKLTQYRVPVFKQKSAVGKLKLLLYELNKGKFVAQLNRTLRAWCDDQSMKSFTCFFQRQYVTRCKEWSSCWRTYLSPDKTMDAYLEPINEVLDAIYMESYTGLMNAFNCLMAFIRDSCLLKVIQWDEGYRLEVIQLTDKNHAEGAEIKNVRTNGSEWVFSENDLDYIVKGLVNDCDKDCGIFCRQCDVCVHQYGCYCKDYVLNFNLCKHIHAARMAMARVNEANEKMKMMEMLKEREKQEEMREKEMMKKEERKNKKERKEKKEKKERKEKKKRAKKRAKKMEKRKRNRNEVPVVACKRSAVLTAKSRLSGLEKSKLSEEECKNVTGLLSSVHKNLRHKSSKVASDARF